MGERWWLGVLSCQECRRQSSSAASPSMDPQCGSDCRLLCATAVYHWTRSRATSEVSSFWTVMNITRRRCGVLRFCRRL